MNKTMTKEEYVASIRELEEIITKYRESSILTKTSCLR